MGFLILWAVCAALVHGSRWADKNVKAERRARRAHSLAHPLEVSPAVNWKRVPLLALSLEDVGISVGGGFVMALLIVFVFAGGTLGRI